MLDGATEWAMQTGPPNWVFVIAILTTPHLWAKRAKEMAKDYYQEKFKEDGQQ